MLYYFMIRALVPIYFVGLLIMWVCIVSDFFFQRTKRKWNGVLPQYSMGGGVPFIQLPQQR